MRPRGRLDSMLSIRLPAELHDKLIQEAQRRRVDVSHVIRQRLWTPERVEALRRSEIHDRAKHRRRNGGLA